MNSQAIEKLLLEYKHRIALEVNALQRRIRPENVPQTTTKNTPKNTANCKSSPRTHARHPAFVQCGTCYTLTSPASGRVGCTTVHRPTPLCASSGIKSARVASTPQTCKQVLRLHSFNTPP
uniref:Uncharacterized protein n=1 Tax=Lygus hesperus TaxID=30085 RepID=A0A146LRU7_LYGHE